METKIVVINTLDAEKLIEFIESDKGKNVLKRMYHRYPKKKTFWQKLCSLFKEGCDI